MTTDFIAPSSAKECRSFFRKRLVETDNPDEQVVARFFGVNTNPCRPMLIESGYLNKIVLKHSINGVIYIPALATESDKDTKSLIKDLRQSPFTFLPIYIGYGAGKDEYNDLKPSFLVFNHNRKEETCDWDEFKNFGLELAERYNQPAVQIKAPGELLSLTDLSGNNASEATEYCYVNPSPCDRGEEMLRYYSTEILVMLEYFR